VQDRSEIVASPADGGQLSSVADSLATAFDAQHALTDLLDALGQAMDALGPAGDRLTSGQAWAAPALAAFRRSG
jgi:hypothetical protein